MTPINAGIKVEEERGPDRTIPRQGTARTAFVGRTLRGPVNRPIFITTFTEFQHVFGGLWQPSPLGYAVEQFFDNGGREALIVRVVNGARCATLDLDRRRCAAALAGAASGHPRISARQRRLRQHCDRGRHGIQSHGAARARPGHRSGGRPGDIPPAVAAADGRALPAARHRGIGADSAGRASCRRSGRIEPWMRRAAWPPATPSSNSDGDDGAPLTDYDLIGSANGSHRHIRPGCRPNISIFCAFRPCRAIKTWGRAPCWWQRATARSAARC